MDKYHANTIFSHDTGRQYAIMFFGLAFPFRNILEIFDQCDGLRKLYNTISPLAILSDKDEERNALNDDEEFMQRQNVRYTAQTLKRYLEAHLAIRAEEELCRDLEGSGASPQPPHPTCKPYRLEQDQVTEHIDTLLQLMNYRGRWEPVDRFIKLGGIQLMLQVAALSYDWTFTGRAETVKCVLDVLAVCSVIPRVQLALCEKLDLPEDASVGMNILLGSAEGEIVQDSPDVQRAALLVLGHLLCGPIIRPGCTRHPDTPTPSKRRGGVKSSDEVINRVWECVRSNNGIMALLQLIQTKTPISDADIIRALACKALVGLARSSQACQIMSKLPIFNNGVLNQLLREPVLQDRRTEHVKFQEHAHELIEKVSGPMSRKNYENHDITLDMLHRASVVASTKIRYNPNQLWSLIHEHMVLSGLSQTAKMLREETERQGEKFVPMVPGYSLSLSLSLSSSSTSFFFCGFSFVAVFALSAFSCSFFSFSPRCRTPSLGRLSTRTAA
jgi:HIV-1 Vpr-binding protein